MAITNIILNLFFKKPNSLLNLSLSLFLILILNPISIENIGLILSAFGTIGIVFLSNPINQILSSFVRIKIIKETLSLTIAAQIMLLPILAYYFNNISLISILSNLLIVPITEYITLIGLIIFCISLFSIKFSKILAYIPELIINYIFKMSEFCVLFDVLNINVPTPKWWMIVFYYAFIYIEFKKLHYKENNKRINAIYDYEIKRLEYIKKLVYLLLLSALIFNMFVSIFSKSFVEVTAIDVGQGDSFLIKSSNGKNILIDGGGSETSEYDVGENVLVPYFLDRWILNIDTVFISHAHADHIEGIYSVMENLNIKRIVIGAYTENNEYISKLKTMCEEKDIPIIKVQAGDMIKIDGINFEILYPKLDSKETNENNLSLLIRANINGVKILFTGDLEEDVEKQIDFDISADILKVAHHGSNTSSTNEFLEKVKPKISIISVSENNLYGHPNRNVVERLKKYSNVFMTKDSGEINFYIYRNGKIKVKTYLK